MGQKIGDTVEEEGIAYSISYVAADVAIQILLSKGLGEVKNVSKADDLVDVARTVDTLRTHLRRVNLTGADYYRVRIGYMVTLVRGRISFCHCWVWNMA